MGLDSEPAARTIQNGIWASLDLQMYRLDQDFETSTPFKPWAGDGSYHIDFQGVSTDHASSGNRAFKLDVSFTSDGFVYLQIPVHIPCVGSLELLTDLYVSSVNGKASAALGADISLDPFPRTGVIINEKISHPTTEWVSQKIDLTTAGYQKATSQIKKYLADGRVGDAGIWMDKIGLFVFGEKGSSISLYVDNIRLKGQIPETGTYRTFVEAAWVSYQNRMTQKIDDKFSRIKAPLVDRAASIIETSRQRGCMFAHEYQELDNLAQDSGYLMSYFQHGNDLEFFAISPTGPRKILPFMYPVPARPSKNVNITACPGEYESGSLVIRARKETTRIMISPSPFVSRKGDVISKDSMDIRVVKCWYQAGIQDVLTEKARFLVPELLLKDDALVKTDHVNQANYLRIQNLDDTRYINISDPEAVIPMGWRVVDADALQPFDLSKDENKQIWLTLQVPPTTPAGSYKGTLTIDFDHGFVETLDVCITVLDVHLPDPCLEYGIYYTGKLVPGYERIDSEYKNERQYRLEMDNLKTHGILAPTLYQPLNSHLPKALRIRSDAGMSKENLYVLSTWTKGFQTLSEWESLKSQLDHWKRIAGQYGYQHVYVYGDDEANLEEIDAQLNAWKMIHQSGARIMAACPDDAVDISHGLLDIGVIRCELNQEIAKNWHSKGARIFSYGNPQVGVENPDVYRRNFGFDLWRAGYDGAMNYAYQYGMNEIWNDFDHKVYRDHVFAYPATDAVIDTIQWEGFREAIDDVRYLTYLLSKDDQTEDGVRQWMNQLNREGLSPEQIRQAIIHRCDS